MSSGMSNRPYCRQCHQHQLALIRGNQVRTSYALELNVAQYHRVHTALDRMAVSSADDAATTSTAAPSSASSTSSSSTSLSAPSTAAAAGAAAAGTPAWGTLNTSAPPSEHVGLAQQPFWCLTCTRAIQPVFPAITCPHCGLGTIEVRAGGLDAASSPWSDAPSAPPVLTSVGSDGKRRDGFQEFGQLLRVESIDLEILRQTIHENGMYPEFRATCWQLLIGYLPCEVAKRQALIDEKRRDYYASVALHFRPESFMTERDIDLLHQIQVDVPRTSSPAYPELFESPRLQLGLTRVLYVWASMNPHVGYFQGLNDLLVPFWIAFLASFTDGLLTLDKIDSISPHQLISIEADVYWCVTLLMNNLCDTLVVTPQGVHGVYMTEKLEQLIAKEDPALHKHFQDHDVDFLFFGFRWMICLLIREVSLANLFHLWDTYLVDGATGFPIFHIYVCAAFLLKFSDELQGLDTTDTLLFLQRLPTHEWGTTEVRSLVARGMELRRKHMFIMHTIARESAAAKEAKAAAQQQGASPGDDV